MTYLNRKLVKSIVPVLLLVFSFCTKNVAGPKGDPGAPGKNGNVQQSQIGPVTQPSSAWADDGDGWESIIYAPGITNNVMTNGEVKVYMQIGTEWWSLPYAVGENIMESSIEEGVVHLKYSAIHGALLPKPGSTIFRVVILSPL